MYIKKTTAKLSRGGNKRVSMLRAEKLGENYASAKGTYIYIYIYIYIFQG